MLYQTYQAHEDLMWPYRTLAKTSIPVLADERSCLRDTKTVRGMAAACQTFALSGISHKRPPFAIDSVMVGDREVAVREDRTYVTPFATLLRETVRTMLADHDVYITDWHNARDVPYFAGPFGLDEYTEHIMSFTRYIGENTHVVAICQPCVSALAAVALMSEDADPCTPASLTLMAGPIDCRINPTAVNKLAVTKSVEWFEKNLIDRVPMRYMGAFRRVYPGFIQLSAFMNMNLERHMNAFRGYYDNLAAGEFEKAEATRSFYEEYFAVADLPAEFYLETVQKVFQ
ncbi:MAG: polyhydroxyalkanoate depolymerase, partial [Usitatibacteraceae bacterium]